MEWPWNSHTQTLHCCQWSWKMGNDKDSVLEVKDKNINLPVGIKANGSIVDKIPRWDLTLNWWCFEIQPHKEGRQLEKRLPYSRLKVIEDEWPKTVWTEQTTVLAKWWRYWHLRQTTQNPWQQTIHNPNDDKAELTTPQWKPSQNVNNSSDGKSDGVHSIPGRTNCNSWSKRERWF